MKLLQNELAKLFKTKKLYVFFFIFLATTSITVYYFNSDDTAIKTVIETANAQSLPLALKNSVALFFSIFMAIYIADIVTDEYKNGTLKLSLLRPVSRVKLLHSKMLAVLMLNMIMAVFFILSAYAIGITAFGWGAVTVYGGVNYSAAEGLLLTLKAYAASILPYMAFGMIGIFVGILSNRMTTTITILISLAMFGEYLNAIPSIKVYSIVNQMYFFHEYFVKTPNPEEVLLSTVVNLAYIFIFYWLAIFFFKKKDLLG